MRGLYLVVGLVTVLSVSLNAQSNGDYQSRQTGDWTTATTWQVFNGGWVNLESGGAGAFQNVIPSNTSGIITIMDQTTVTIPNGQTVHADQIEWENNFGGTTGTLSVALGGTLVVENGGSGDDVRLLNDFVTVATLEVAGTLQLITGATMVEDDYAGSTMAVSGTTYRVLSGGVHIHTTGTNVDAIPVADFQDGSTFRIVAAGTPLPVMDPGISFYNFEWNGAAQSAIMNFAGNLRAVRNDLTINGTNGQILQLSTTVGYTLTVGHNFSILGDSRVQFGTTGSNTITVTGNFDVQSTSASANAISVNATGVATVINVTGDFLKSGASQMNFLVGTTIGRSTIMNVSGNYSHTAGTLLRSNSLNGTVTINFTGASTRTFTTSGAAAVQNGVNYNVAITKVLDLGQSAVIGGGTFTLRANATIRVGSADGINVAATNLGNIRVTGTRTYFSNSNIVYNGTVAQVLGDEWATGAALSTPAVNLTINNSSVEGVTNDIGGQTNVVGNLTLTNGSLNIGQSNTLNIQSNFSATAGTIGGDPTSSLKFTNAGTFTGSLTFTAGKQDLDTLQLGRAGDITLGSSLTIANSGKLMFEAGSGNLIINGQTLTVNGDILQTGGGIASTVNTSNLAIGGFGTLTNLALVSPILLNNITLSRTSGAIYSWNASTTVSGTIDLAAGTFNHLSGLTMGTGSTFLRRQGSGFTGSALLATTRYNVTYIGAVATSGELPTTGTNRLENLTTSGVITLDKNIIINGDLNINGGQFIAGAHDISMRGPTFAVNGGTFNINAGNTVTFARAGTTVLSGSTIDDSQFGHFVINSGTTVNAPPNNIGVSGTWNNGGTFVPGTGTVTFNGTTQTIDAAGQPFFNVSIDQAGTKTLASTLDVNGELDITGGSTLSTGSNIVDVAGPLLINASSTLSAGSSAVNVDGQLTIESGSTLTAGTSTINVSSVWLNQGTFTAGTGTVVFDGTTQSISNNGQSFFNLGIATAGTKTLAAPIDVNGQLTINSGATFDVSVANHAVNVAGNLVNNGTFNPRTGTVFLDGTTNQTVSGTTNTVFNNITGSSDARTITIGSIQSLAGELTLTGGIFNPNDFFVLTSSATRDARIAPLTGGAQMHATGRMTVQRFLPNITGTAAYRYLSSPVTNAFVSALPGDPALSGAGWKDDFPVTGSFNDPSTVGEWPQFPTMNTGNPSIYRYNETFPTSTSRDDRYERYPLNGTNSNTAAIENGRGYAVFVRHTAPVLIELFGRARVDDVTISVTNTNQTLDVNEDGWNLIGNPYASAIDWDNVTTPGDAQGIAIKDNTNSANLGPGSFVYKTHGGTAIPIDYDGTIRSGQGFWVHKTNPGSGNVVFHEADKITDDAVHFDNFLKDGVTDILRIRIAGNEKQDELVIQFAQDALDAADGQFDAFKLDNDFINFSSLSSDGKKLAINAFSSLTCSKEIPLVLADVTPGAHAFTFTQFDSFSEGVDIRLLDSFTGETFQVGDESDVYNFQVTSSPNSFGANRFKMFIGYHDLDLALAVEAQDICEGNDAQIHIQAPQAGVAYRATLNGTTVSDEVVATSGSDLTLSIPKANLTGTDNLIVLMAKVGGCSAMPLSNSVVVNIKGIPTISNVTEESRCGEGSVTLSASGAPAGGGYKWYLTEDATDPIAGETGSSFITPALTKTKTFFVSAVNALGCEGGKMAVTATVTYTYDIAGVTGAQACPGENSTISATGAPEDGSYHWYVTQNSAEPIPNQSADTFVTTPLAATTTYYVATVNAEGCESSRVPVTVEVTSLEDAVITVQGNVLASNSDTGNQWHLNGTAIPGATGKTHTASESGIYKLVVTNGTCTTEIEKEFSVTGDIDFAGSKGLLLYPNPSNGTIYVELATTNPVSVSVKNQLGAEVAAGDLKQEGETRKGQLDITGHANGLYLVVIKSGEHTVIRKIIKN